MLQDAEIQRLRCKGPERHLRYSFHDKSLLMEAFTHCSWPDPNPPCYQRLEFVGDAVLDLLITRAIVTGFRYNIHLRQTRRWSPDAMNPSQEECSAGVPSPRLFGLAYVWHLETVFGDQQAVGPPGASLFCKSLSAADQMWHDMLWQECVLNPEIRSL